ncbi:membrane protein [Klebsiella pneumoniae subsp. pneumoniae]|nr:membrane protein [Klebsiella pneumoniae subsp. pneumoniae]
MALFLLALGNWFGAETGYVSGWGAYWLGMNYPIRFVLFGGALLRSATARNPCFASGSCYRQQGDGPHVPVYCAVDPVDFRQLRRRELVPGEPGATPAVGAAVAVAAGVCIFISLKTDDGMLRGLRTNLPGDQSLYRFFEFFWNGMHKVLFFLILAVSLAVIGRYAERIWHAGNVKP